MALIDDVKAGLGIPAANTQHNTLLQQKIDAVKSYMSGAGVSDDMIENVAAVGAIVVGVTDLWSLNPGEVKFSPVFISLVSQLALRSLEAEEE